MTLKLDASEKWELLMSYMAHWPYSPYTDLEYRELVKVIRSIERDGVILKLGE